MTIPIENIYGILAAPPCTEFSLAKTSSPRDLHKGMTTVEACLKIIWACQFDVKNHLKFWALENPVCLLSRFLGKPAFRFEQWEFGNGINKPTCLWGLFNNPVPTQKTMPDIAKFRNKVSNRNLNSKEYSSPKCPEEYRGVGLKRSDIRAITPSGFAQAFYKVNK